MNERTKELAEQCWDERLDGRHFDKEMFAELVRLDERQAILKYLIDERVLFEEGVVASGIRGLEHHG